MGRLIVKKKKKQNKTSDILFEFPQKLMQQGPGELRDLETTSFFFLLQRSKNPLVRFTHVVLKKLLSF